MFLFSRVARVYLCAARSFGTSQCAMGAFDAEFAQAKERLNSLKEDPGNEVKLKIYALFKQVMKKFEHLPKKAVIILKFEQCSCLRNKGDMSCVMRKHVYAICEQQRRRSVRASTHSDQRLCYSLTG